MVEIRSIKRKPQVEAPQTHEEEPGYEGVFEAVGKDNAPQCCINTMFIATLISMMIGVATMCYAEYTLIYWIIPTRLVSSFFGFTLIAIFLIGLFFPGYVAIGCLGSIEGNVNYLRQCCFAMCTCVLGSSIVIAYTGGVYFAMTADGSTLLTPMERAIVNYHEDAFIAKQIDDIQISLHCCGVNGMHDWNNNRRFKCFFMNANIERCDVPASCCVAKQGYENRRNFGAKALNQSAAAGYENRSYCGAKVLNESVVRFYEKDNVIYTSGCKEKINYFLFATFKEITIVFTFMVLCQLTVWRMAAGALFLYFENVDEENQL